MDIQTSLRPTKPVNAIISGANSIDRVFFTQKIMQPIFSPEFHFHEQCQLVYIHEGTGKRIVGDSVEKFEKDELIFIGSNVPHVWTDERSVKVQQLQPCCSLSLFISPNLFREHFSALGDVKGIEILFDNAKRGMKIVGNAKQKIISLLNRATKQFGIERIITLLHLIDILSSTNEYVFLSSPNYLVHAFQNDNDRMKKVCTYLLNNFDKKIQLRQVADIAGMNPKAFCRFFKSRTQKSLTTFVNEIRIAHACKLLIEKEESISRIAYDCGFNNVSNFNLFFKLFKNIPPRQFRKELCGFN